MYFFMCLMKMTIILLLFDKNKYNFTFSTVLIGCNHFRMKRFILAIMISLFIIPAMSQVAKQDVIASAGGYDKVSGISLSWTLGETIVPTFSSDNLILTHGFQQQLIVTSVEENLESLVKITLYPNPAIDLVTLVFDEPLDSEVQITVMNFMGKLVRTDFMEASMLEKKIDLHDLPGGIYFMRLTKGKLSNVYKVVKL